uniref:Xylanase inhibitor C-terminal domain-containing protein n=1 Tax=Triticum urartu TaxID=4572 RepID=A0A8R7VB17_TRIUA
MSEYSFLRFDANIPSQPPPGVHRQSTHILTPTQKSGHSYYVNLAGVRVGNSRVPSVTGEMFRRRRSGVGGCMIDIGTKMTAFVHAAYTHVEQAVRLHLQHRRAHFVQLQGHHLCVHQPAPHHDVLPSMTLHFENCAWLRVMPEHMFMKIVDEAGHQYQCLGLVSAWDMTVIGAMQQINHRFIFDLQASNPTLSFNPEACHLD